jgi:hypothetical protein
MPQHSPRTALTRTVRAPRLQPAEEPTPLPGFPGVSSSFACVPSPPPPHWPHIASSASSSSSPSADDDARCALRACTLRLVASHSGAVLYERGVPSAEVAHAQHIGTAWARGQSLPPDVLLALAHFRSGGADSAAAAAGGGEAGGGAAAVA